MTDTQLNDFIEKLLMVAQQSESQGDKSRAETIHKTILSIIPFHFISLFSLGIYNCIEGQTVKGRRLFNSAHVIHPYYDDIYLNIAVSYEQDKKFQESEKAYLTVLVINPSQSRAYCNLAKLLAFSKNNKGAESNFIRSMRSQRDDYLPYLNFAAYLCSLDDRVTALTYYSLAVIVNPQIDEIYSNFSLAQNYIGNKDEGIKLAYYAICINPKNSGAHVSLATVLLMIGKLQDGWREHEWFRKSIIENSIKRDFPVPLKREFSVPQWYGEEGHGRSILIHSEMGYGDVFQFCRYIPLIAEKDWKVYVEAPQQIFSLFEDISNIEGAIRYGDPLPKIEAHCPIMSLPLAFNTSLETIPTFPNYLKAKKNQVLAWKKRIEKNHPPHLPKNALKIGIAWIGTVNPVMKFLTYRSISNHYIKPLFQEVPAHFINLQTDVSPLPQDFPLTDFMPEINNFAETAAIISNLDLVISVDTSVAHLAAALGKKVYLLLNFTACWRWMSERSDSPWYPTMKIFRKSGEGEWSGVINTVIEELKQQGS